ncbi:uncharacterized protein LOC113295875 [Papaver somniferum]|uniref:uncharacterized protein LOC113295875 n=1 Tax=Papaver somniferum TaxID=3469 RepID=UPI000E6FB1AA|nr:uncharacterized protein LOC113295875 [Papaver somniferum]
MALCSVAQVALFGSPLNLRLYNPAAVKVKKFIVDCLFKESEDYFYMCACLLWAIWKERNALVFENQKPNIGHIIRDGLFWYNRYNIMEGEDNNATRPVSMPQVITSQLSQWLPPRQNYVKINVDVAVEDFHSSCAVIATNSNGDFLRRGCQFLKQNNPLIAEAYGFLLAFQLAEKEGFNKIIVEGDCQEVVYILNGQTTMTPWRVLGIIERI